MATYSGTEFNDLAKLLFQSLSTVNPDFNPLTYLDKFTSMTTPLDQVTFVYNDIKRYPNVFAKFIKDTKSDEVAMQHADSGKQKFMAGNYWEALEDFSRTVSTAKSDAVLSLGYGHRSECFLKLKMPGKCLEEIERAVNYPKDLLDHLNQQKVEAHNMKASVVVYYEPVPDYEDCVKIAEERVIASRDINIGEIISVEAPFTSVLTSDRLTHCHQCLNICYNPIPCNTCTVAMFCGESCKEKARFYHKYECPILLTVCYRYLCEFAMENTLLLALKVALITKNCIPESRTLQLRETGDNVHVNFLKTEANFSRLDSFHQAILTGLMFELLWNHTSFFTGIFSNSDSADKFKETMFFQLKTTCTNAAKIYEYVHKPTFNGTNSFGIGAYSFFSMFAHSCCANVMKTYHGTKLVLRALNTIKTGEECFVNRYGLRYDVAATFDRRQFLHNRRLPKCECRACEEDWTASLGDLPQICKILDIEVMELGDVVRDVVGSDIGKAARFLTKLIGALEESEEKEPEGNVLALKNLIVHCYVIFGNRRVEFDGVQNCVVLVP